MATPALVPTKKGGVGGFLHAAMPWIAKALQFGGPLGAAAGGILQATFGGTTAPTTVDEAEARVSEAISQAGGSADQILKAQIADQEFQKTMAQLHIDSLEKFDQMMYANVADARAREIAVKDSMPKYLAWAAVLMLVFCIVLLAFVDLPNGARDSILLLMGVVSASYKDVYNYFFGSSQSSDRKTELLAAAPAVQMALPAPRQ